MSDPTSPFEYASSFAAGEVETGVRLDGMEAQYDDKGNYIYPEGFDPDTQEWLPGYESQREEWERRYAAARERFEAHKRQLEDARRADAEAAAEAGEATSYVSEQPANSGTLASDEALAALREKLAGR